ncbi:MAG: substrate-binding domain-containing protein [Hyphomicrobiales bacterium]
MHEYLTTKELANLLRIKERKVYDLAASGEVPCSKAMGKLLFPRAAVEAWLAAERSGPDPQAPGIEQTAASVPNVFLGSHDPLLDWALRESRCGIATYFDGSADGLERFAKGEGIATGLHLFSGRRGDWNIAQVKSKCAAKPAALVEWARRQRGLVIAPGVKGAVQSLDDLAGKRVVRRQKGAGAEHLFQHLLAKAGIDVIDGAVEVRSEADAALAVFEGKADAAFGLQALAEQYKLAFVPLIEERFDILVLRRAWFSAPMQTFLTFCKSDGFKARAGEFTGYDVSGFGTVHFNGA